MDNLGVGERCGTLVVALWLVARSNSFALGVMFDSTGELVPDDWRRGANSGLSRMSSWPGARRVTTRAPQLLLFGPLAWPTL